MFEKSDRNDLMAVISHLTEILDILNKQGEAEIRFPASGISFAECMEKFQPEPKPVSWDDICGKWSYNTDVFKELKGKIPPCFTIVREDDVYLISFDDKRELIHKLLADDLEEGIFYFFIGSCYFKLCYNPDLKGIYIVPYFNYQKRAEG
jgi:hypothetical protein